MELGENKYSELDGSDLERGSGGAHLLQVVSLIEDDHGAMKPPFRSEMNLAKTDFVLLKV